MCMKAANFPAHLLSFLKAGSPVVNSISTNKGPIAGGTRLTIIGSMLAPSDEPRIYLHVNGQLDVLLCANAIGYVKGVLHSEIFCGILYAGDA